LQRAPDSQAKLRESRVTGASKTHGPRSESMASYPAWETKTHTAAKRKSQRRKLLPPRQRIRPLPVGFRRPPLQRQRPSLVSATF